MDLKFSFRKKTPVIKVTADQPSKEAPSGASSAVRNLVDEELGRGDETSIVNLLNRLLERASELSASDIHLDPGADSVRVRYRVDGVLHDAHTLPKALHGPIISRIKILAHLRTDEHQAAQDGRFRADLENSRRVDVRVSVTPIYHGENAVLRLLSDNAEQYTLESLGFSRKDRDKILKAIRRPHGMILATGPTGSGKTTSLYTILRMLNKPEVNIVTIEDPIEYGIDGIEQIQVNTRTSLNFANGLRSILRQDPDIIMVGEIRDSETAGIAVNTALTGHLLLSTLHTNDAATTLPRLLDMKIEPYLISSTVNIAIGQRLLRKICKDCKQEKGLTATEQKSIFDALPIEAKKGKQKFYAGKGCASCGNTGFRGRIGIYEVLVPNEAIREAILRKASAADISRLAVESGMTTMLEDGYQKALDGITTIEEVLRLLHE